MIEDVAQVHKNEAEVAGDCAALLRKIGHGEEVDRDGQPVAIIRPADPTPRTFSELIALADQREKERGYAITLDEDYAGDRQQIVRERKPWAPSSWD
jgi:hypothetical protein